MCGCAEGKHLLTTLASLLALGGQQKAMHQLLQHLEQTFQTEKQRALHAAALDMITVILCCAVVGRLNAHGSDGWCCRRRCVLPHPDKAA